LDVPGDSAAARAGLQKDDVMVGCNGKPVRTIKELRALKDKAVGGKATVSVYRKQKRFAVELTDIDRTEKHSDA
jgi:S1-C subfamily serine protease